MVKITTGKHNLYPGMTEVWPRYDPGMTRKIQDSDFSSKKDTFRFDFRDAVMPVLRQERRFEFRNVHDF